MLDLDNFKNINDQFGHAVGDSALVKMAELLRQACKGGDDFIGRMGGDEFIVVGERRETAEIKQLMNKIYASCLAYNKRKQAEYFLLPSMGYSVFENEDKMDTFLATADQVMYRNKQEKKLAR